MKLAGIYTIVFAVTNSQGLSASVNRTLVVEPVCPVGETLCSNKVSSSILSAPVAHSWPVAANPLCSNELLRSSPSTWQSTMLTFSRKRNHCGHAAGQRSPQKQSGWLLGVNLCSSESRQTGTQHVHTEHRLLHLHQITWMLLLTAGDLQREWAVYWEHCFGTDNDKGSSHHAH